MRKISITVYFYKRKTFKNKQKRKKKEETMDEIN